MYLFSGEEDFLIDETVDALIDAAVEREARSFDLDILHGSDVDGSEIAVRASAYPLAGKWRVVVVREFEKAANKDALIPYLENPSGSTILVIIASRRDDRLKIFKVLKDKSVILECKPLYEDKIPSWIDRRIEQKGKKASPEACQLIQSRVGTSLRGIQNEIDKIFTFVAGRNNVEVEDVAAVVGISRQYNVFELQRAVGQHRVEKALEILGRMLEEGEQPTGIIVTLSRFFQKLWVYPDLRATAASDSQLAASIGVNPYFLRDYAEAARHYSPARVEQILSSLLEADIKIKTSAGTHETIMTMLLYEIMKLDSSMEPA